MDSQLFNYHSAYRYLVLFGKRWHNQRKQKHKGVRILKIAPDDLKEQRELALKVAAAIAAGDKRSHKLFFLAVAISFKKQHTHIPLNRIVI